MTKTKIQIVDKDQKPLRGLSKKQAYTDGAIHQIVRIAIFDKNKNMLLQKRSLNEDTFPGAWDQAAGGHVDFGEDIFEAAERETLEELGLKFKFDASDLVCTYYTSGRYGKKSINRFNYVFQKTLSGIRDIKLNAEEVAEIGCFSTPEIIKLIRNNKTTDGLVDVLKKLEIT